MMPRVVALTLTLNLVFSVSARGQSAPYPPQVEGEQHLTTIFGVWIPGSEPVAIEDPRAFLPTADQPLVLQSLPGGRVIMRGRSATNRAGIVSPRATMIILFTEMLAQPQTLTQPYAGTMLYVQEGPAFRRFPADGQLADIGIQLTQDDPRYVRYMIERLVMGATGGSTLVTVPASEASDRVTQAGTPVVPRKTRDVAPIYPPEALKAGIRGSVVVEIVIAASGKVIQARLLRSLPFLGQAAIDCVMQWEYAPMPQSVVATATVTFAP